MSASIDELKDLYLKKQQHHKNVPSFGLIDQTFGDPNAQLNVGKSCQDFQHAVRQSITDIQAQLESDNPNKSLLMPLQDWMQSQSVFKEFFVVGVNAYEIHEARRAQRESRRSFTSPDAPLRVSPTTIYTHIKQGIQAETCERRKVVKDFCFPDGVQVQPVKSKTELRRLLS